MSFEQPSYTVGEGGSVTVKVTLDSAAGAQVDIPIDVTTQGGATSADYTLSSTTVTIAGGAGEGSVTFTAVDDPAVERGEAVRLSLGSLPAGYRKARRTRPWSTSATTTSHRSRSASAAPPTTWPRAPRAASRST